VTQKKEKSKTGDVFRVRPSGCSDVLGRIALIHKVCILLARFVPSRIHIDTQHTNALVKNQRSPLPTFLCIIPSSRSTACLCLHFLTMFAPSSQTSSSSDLPDSRLISFESNASGVSSWEDLQRVSLGLMKCQEIMESYSADSLKAGISTTISFDQIKMKLGLANISLGRSMQSLLQTSFSNVHRGANDSTAQIPVQVHDATAEANSTRPAIFARLSMEHRESATVDDSPLTMATFESNSAKRTSVAPQQPNTSDGASLSMASWETKRSSVAPRQSTAADGAANFESNSAKRTSVAPQQPNTSDGASLSMASWETKRSSVAPRQSTAADGAANFESNSAKQLSLAPQQSTSPDGSNSHPLSRLPSAVKAVMAANALQRGGVQNLSRQLAQQQFLDNAEDAAVVAPLSMASLETKRSSVAPRQSVAADSAPLSMANLKSKNSVQNAVSNEDTHFADVDHKNEIIAGINARVASERMQKPFHSSSPVESSDDDDVQSQYGNWHRGDALNMESHAASRPKYLSVSSIPSRFDQGHADSNQVTRPRLSVSSGQGSRFATKTNDSDFHFQTGLSEFSRHLLGGSFEHQNPVSDERAVSNVRFRADQLGRNGYNPTAERSSVFVSFLTHSTPALCQQTHLNVAGASIIVQCCQFIRGIWTGAQEN